MVDQPHHPLVLFYTPFFERPVDVDAISCGRPCGWTHDIRCIAEAAAVVFHIPNRREFGDARKYPGQLWIAWSHESVANYRLMRDPGFMAHFDLRMTYESDADIWAPYLPKRAWWEEARRRPVPVKTSDTPVAMFQSSHVNVSGREDFLMELGRHIPIASYGRFLNNRVVDGPDLGSRTKIETIARYPFCIAFENSICPDYVTEKLFDPLCAGTVPVYFGAPNARDFAPEHSFIDASDFSGPRELAAYLRHLLNSPDEYQSYFKWRAKPFTRDFEASLDRIETPLFCRLVDAVHDHLSRNEGLTAGLPKFEFGLAAFLRTRTRRWQKYMLSGRATQESARLE